MGPLHAVRLLRARRGRHLSRAGVLAATAVLALANSGCAPVARGASPDVDGCAGSHQPADPGREAAMRAATLCLLNAERARHGAGPLSEDAALAAAALRHSLDMSRRDYFEHHSPEGVQPWMRIANAGYDAPLVGENLAWGEAELSTPAAAMRMWMDSPSHRDNLLEPRYTQVGIGLAFDAPVAASVKPAAVYTTTFGSAAVSTR